METNKNINPNDLVRVISVKFSEYGKSYYYLCDNDDAQIGGYVLIDDITRACRIIDVKVVKISDLPVDYNKMKYAWYIGPEDIKL